MPSTSLFPVPTFEYVHALRLDALGDPAGALAAFDDAIVLAPRAGFREDAEARRVEALDRMNDTRCPAARQAFLARYPHG
ncbi:MAG TPA: hypothetical protein VMI75_30350, partial [Polyangiaceae bacterium]|nr:hypothetical protein [Polyangiaceae bacterium]